MTFYLAHIEPKNGISDGYFIVLKTLSAFPSTACREIKASELTIGMITSKNT